MRNPEGLEVFLLEKKSLRGLEGSIMNDVSIHLGLQAKLRLDTLHGQWNQ